MLDPLLVQFLGDRDVACPFCRYNLRNLTSGRCTECGREITLTVGLTEPYLRAWIGAALVVFGCAGVGIDFMVMVLWDGWPDEPAVRVATAGFMLAVPLTLVTIAWRRGFLRLSRPHQWQIVTALAIFFGLAAAVMILKLP